MQDEFRLSKGEAARSAELRRELRHLLSGLGEREGTPDTVSGESESEPPPDEAASPD